VRVTGETLWLPSDATVPDPAASFTDLDVELYGRDIALPDGQLALGPDGDLVTVEGRANIVQALGQRIRTTRGELVLHPEYGMETLLAVGVEGTHERVKLSGLELARTVLQDPRVVGIGSLNVRFADTANRIDMDVRLIGPGQRSLALNEIIPDSIVRTA